MKMFEIVGRFVIAMVKAGWTWLFRGSVLVADAEFDARVKTCEGGCPFFRAGTRQCSVCKCFVDLKAQLRTERCPDNRWKK